MCIFVDEHLHLLAMAAERLSVDADRPTIAGVLDAIGDHAQNAPRGTWIRAVGYDDALLEERRHPTRAELDEAGGDHPVVLHHRTGHLAVLNSEALIALGVPDRSDGFLVDRHDLLAKVPKLPIGELSYALDDVLGELAASDVVAATDATHTNDREALEFLDRPSPVEITAMAGWDRLAGLDYGERVGRVLVGPAKIMPGRDGQALTATGEVSSLGEAVASAHESGFPVAVHVMDIDTLAGTLDALEASAPPAGLLDRIEHCSLALPEQLDRLSRLPVAVVTQPSFVTRRAAKYREQLTDVEQQWLWPLGSLLRRDIPVRFSSDAPVAPSRPKEWLEAATRRDLNPAERISLSEALAAASVGSSLAEGG